MRELVDFIDSFPTESFEGWSYVDLYALRDAIKHLDIDLPDLAMHVSNNLRAREIGVQIIQGIVKDLDVTPALSATFSQRVWGQTVNALIATDPMERSKNCDYLVQALGEDDTSLATILLNVKGVQAWQFADLLRCNAVADSGAPRATNDRLSNLLADTAKIGHLALTIQQSQTCNQWKTLRIKRLLPA